MYRHHVMNRENKMCFEEIMYPRYVDVVRQMPTTLEILQGHTIDDHWNVDCLWPLSGSWIGLARFTIPNKPPTRRTHVGRWKTDKFSSYIQAWSHVARRLVGNDQTFSTRSKTAKEYRDPGWTLHAADWEEFITLLRRTKKIGNACGIRLIV